MLHFTGDYLIEKPSLSNMSALRAKAQDKEGKDHLGHREVFLFYCRWHLCMAEVEVLSAEDAEQKEKSISHAAQCLDLVHPYEHTTFKCNKEKKLINNKNYR